jgi:hypothetical protein
MCSQIKQPRSSDTCQCGRCWGAEARKYASPTYDVRSNAHCPQKRCWSRPTPGRAPRNGGTTTEAGTMLGPQRSPAPLEPMKRPSDRTASGAAGPAASPVRAKSPPPKKIRSIFQKRHRSLRVSPVVEKQPPKKKQLTRERSNNENEDKYQSRECGI